MTPAVPDSNDNLPQVSLLNFDVKSSAATNNIPKAGQQFFSPANPLPNLANNGGFPHTTPAGPGGGQSYSSNQSKPAPPSGLTDPDQVFQGQEVTQYCPIGGCSYVPFKTYDKSMLSTCFEILKWHLKVDHNYSDSDNLGPSSSRERISREYQAATKPKTITKVLDDATFNLCEGSTIFFIMVAFY